MKTEKAVVIFSGGQDSTTCLYWAIKYWGAENVEAITFNYGQKHSVELECAKKICEKESIKQTVIDISFLDTIVESALTSNGDVNEKNDKGLPASFVPNRNQLFITLAHALAQKIGAKSLVTGVCQTDYSGYPDCRMEFIRELANTSNLGSMSDIHIHTPLMYLTKADTWAFANRLKVLDEVVKMSHTCYNGAREEQYDWGFGCNNCPACKLRREGYEEYVAQLKLHQDLKNEPTNLGNLKS